MCLGEHVIKTYCKQQNVIALSSAEAELYAMVAASAETLALVAYARGLGLDLDCELYCDSAAALGIAQRAGIGKDRHLCTQGLWVKEVRISGRIIYKKVLGEKNPADLLTKHMSAELSAANLVFATYVGGVNQTFIGYPISKGITYSLSGSKGSSFRILPEGSIYDVIGSSIFKPNDKNYDYYSLLAFLNSKLSYYILDCLNPTAATQVGDIERLPFVLLDDDCDKLISFLSERNFLITDFNNSTNIYEPNFKRKKPLFTREEIIKILNIESRLASDFPINDIDVDTKIKGKVDRIDEYNGTLRIIDYKTGVVEPRDLEIGDWGDLTLDYLIFKK